jgi:hypothetical protein
MSAIKDRIVDAHEHAAARGYRAILTAHRDGIDVEVWDGMLRNTHHVAWVDIEMAVVNPLPAAIDKCIEDVTMRRE